jgi:serine/threonine protein kinase
VAELKHHLVLCTAAHSCHNNLRKLDGALKQCASRIARRHARMKETFSRIEALVTPLGTVRKYAEMAAAISWGSESEPLRQTHELMEMRERARESLKHHDPAVDELAGQVHALVTRKMELHWDLLSLDPSMGSAADKAPAKPLVVANKGMSMREFQLVAPIGTGGYGTVWLARRRVTGDQLAIKVLSRKSTAAKKMAASVRFEKHILAYADSAYIVKLLFSFSSTRHFYMAMEFLPGGDCGTLVNTYGFVEEVVARWLCAEALLGLEYLHEQGVIHRDVKPQNMLLTAEGHVKLADFGLSAAEDPDDDDEGEESGRENSDEVKPKKAVGTPDYLAPEMLLLKPFSFPIDFWAIGVVLFQFLVGETPFYADSAQATYERILHVPPDIPPPEDLSEGSVSLLHALLIKDPAKRLGANGVAEIKAHAFFAPIDWETPLCEQQSPCKPTLHDPKDATNFPLNALARLTADRMREELQADHSEEVAPNPNDEDDEPGLGSSFRIVNANELAKIQMKELTDAGTPSSSSPGTSG